MILAVPLGLLIYTMYQEGTFDTTKNSLLILVSGINRFRRLEKEDLADVEEMAAKNEKLVNEMNAEDEKPVNEMNAEDEESVNEMNVKSGQSINGMNK